MWFILGYIAGLVTATLIVATLVYFKKIIEEKIKVVGQAIERNAPVPGAKKGFIFEPDEVAERRETIIEENRKQGKGTKLSDLL
jgi:hypothetical protein